MKKYSLIVLVMLAFISCSKDETAPNPGGNPPVVNPPVVSLEDTLCRRWIVQEAWYNGSPDASSAFLIINIKKDGSYLLEKNNFNGTWEFIENQTKVLIDKNEPNYKTTWKIISISSKEMLIEFKSPFSGGTSKWLMRPKP